MKRISADNDRLATYLAVPPGNRLDTATVLRTRPVSIIGYASIIGRSGVRLRAGRAAISVARTSPTPVIGGTHLPHDEAGGYLRFTWGSSKLDATAESRERIR